MNSLLEDNTEEVFVDPSKDYLKELVGDGKKFKTVEELARGKYEADLYVETLKRRQDQIREDYLKLDTDYKARAKLEELIDQLSNRQNQSSNDDTIVNDKIPQPSFKPEDIESLVSNQILKNETTKKQSDNFNLVRDKMKERYGSNYQNVIKEQIQDLGITVDELNDMARKSPKVILKTLGLDEEVTRDPFQAPPRSQQRTDQFGHKARERTWSYYQDLKRDDPKAYWSKDIAVQMHNDAIRLGEAFKDGDYNKFEPRSRTI